MRFSVLSEDDIAAHDRFPFANASVIELPAESEGQKYIYAQFGYDTGTYATVKAAIDIARVNM